MAQSGIEQTVLDILLKGDKALHIAAANPNVEVLSVVMDRLQGSGSLEELINKTGDKFFGSPTPLHIAFENSYEHAELLVKKGANCNIPRLNRDSDEVCMSMLEEVLFRYPFTSEEHVEIILGGGANATPKPIPRHAKESAKLLVSHGAEISDKAASLMQVQYGDDFIGEIRELESTFQVAQAVEVLHLDVEGGASAAADPDVGSVALGEVEGAPE